jgi:CheY-like chemotaxis protein
VEDTGIGISPEQQERIFDAFVQSEGQRNRKFGGTGLGLAITRRLVHLMNGEIQLESVVNQGSRFIVHLPSVECVSLRAIATTPDTSELSLQAFAPARILVVDDVASNRQLLAGYFRQTSHVLHFAETGEEAICRARILRPDVILMDLRMPDMDGISVIQAIRETEGTQPIPIVMVTASSQLQDEIKLRQICQGFVRKPVTQSSLIDALRPLLPTAEAQNPSHAFSKGAMQDAQPPDAPSSLYPSDAALSPEQMEDLSNHLHHLAITLWHPLQQTLAIEHIETFISTLSVLAAQYPYAPLVRYALTLEHQLDAFDWDNLPDSLAAFEHLHRTIDTFRGTCDESDH